MTTKKDIVNENKSDNRSLLGELEQLKKIVYGDIQQPLINLISWNRHLVQLILSELRLNS